MPAVSETIRRQYLWLFFLVGGITAIMSALVVSAEFNAYVTRTKAELAREAYITNTQIENSLVDVTKLLDVALPIVTQALDEGKLTPALAHQILASQRKTFSAFATDPSLMLTIYLDENGWLVATSAGVADQPINSADRLYFQTLKNDPSRPFSIGNLVVARTTGLLTFHIARPLIDGSGKFRGVLAQQLLANEVAATLAAAIDGLSVEKIVVHIGNGNVAFIYPAPTSPGDIDASQCLIVHDCIVADGRRAAAIDVPATESLARDSYVGFAVSGIHSLETSAMLSKGAVMAGFMREYRSLIAYIFLGFVGIALVIWRFYRQTLAFSWAQTVSLTDELTQIKNRRAFDTLFPPLWKASFRTRQPISALFIDIDHFKKFNDQYGHDRGDDALVAVARTIEACVNRPLDLCCRWGGEEFAIVLPDTDEQGAIYLANEILAAVRAIHLDFGEGKQPKITVSIGIACTVVTEKNQKDDLIDMADKAMYVAKQAGRDRLAIHGKPPA